MAKGRYGYAGNGVVSSLPWKEDMGTAPLRDHSLDGGRKAGALIDPQGRCLDYLRLAVTDRCNLRCRYCMPDTGVPATAPGETLSFDELTRACAVLVGAGVRKIRITGGEPLARRGVVEWMGELTQLAPGLEILLTTNGVLLEEHLPGLVEAGLKRVNLSLDTLDPDTWKLITRREGFAAARRSIDVVLEAGIGLKVNVVVQPGVNDHEILDFVELTRERPMAVRFIEPMPFSGSDTMDIPPVSGTWIRERIASAYSIRPLHRGQGDVDCRFGIDGHAGTVGIIEGNSRSFCGDCRRLRLNARGELRTCLYGSPQADLREALRSGATDPQLLALIASAVGRRLEDGHAAEAAGEGAISMARIGG